MSKHFEYQSNDLRSLKYSDTFDFFATTHGESRYLSRPVCGHVSRRIPARKSRLCVKKKPLRPSATNLQVTFPLARPRVWLSRFLEETQRRRDRRNRVFARDESAERQGQETKASRRIYDIHRFGGTVSALRFYALLYTYALATAWLLSASRCIAVWGIFQQRRYRHMHRMTWFQL